MFLRKKISAFLIVMLICIFASPFFVGSAEAAALNQAALRFNRIQTSITDVGIVVMIEPSGSSDEDYIDIDFAAGIGVDGTAANITTSTSSLPTGCTALSTTSSQASNVTGQSVEFTISSPANPLSGTLYCFNITGGIDTPGSTGSFVSTIRTEDSGHTEIESTEITTYYVSNDSITVTAVVPPTFTFNLGATSTSFTTDLSTSDEVNTTGVTGTVVTNAGNGWTAYLRSANGGLDSVVTGDTVDTVGSIDNSPTTMTPNNEQYQLHVAETSDAQTNGTPDPEYAGSIAGPQSGGTFNSTALEPIASGTASTSNYVFTMYGIANISGLTQAASDYSDTWTVVGAGNF